MRPVLRSLGTILLLAVTAAARDAKELDFAFVYPYEQRLDYVDFGTAERTYVDLPIWTQARNLKSFGLHYQGEEVAGDWVLHAEFFYELDSVLHGARRTLRRDFLNDYPDLLKRYDAIRPDSVSAMVAVTFENEDWNVSWPIYLKIEDLDLVYGNSRDGRKHRASPVVADHWTDRFSKASPTEAFTPADRTEQDDAKKAWRKRTRITATPIGLTNVFLKIKWPEAEIDAIADLYDQYRAEGRKMDRQFAALNDDRAASGGKPVTTPTPQQDQQRMADEIARLKAQQQQAQAQGAADAAEKQRRQAEIERLRAEQEGLQSELEHLRAQSSDDAHTPAAPLPAYRGSSDFAAPIDAALRPGEAFWEKGRVGLKVNGRVVFESTALSGGSPANAAKTIFAFYDPKGGSALVNTRGKPLTIGGYPRFNLLSNPSPSSPMKLVGFNPQSGVVFTTTKEYATGPGTMTEAEFARFRSSDSQPERPAPPSRDSGGGVNVGFSLPTARLSFVRGEFLEVDDRQRVLARQPAYVQVRN